MKILKTGDREFRMTLAPVEVHIFISCMNETIKQIRASEYPTRMGAEVEEIKAVIASLEAALK